MIELYDKETGTLLGTITEDQLAFLVERLEEESGGDQDYYLDPATLDALEQGGMDPQLSTLLRGALGDREGAEVGWRRP